MAESAAQSTTTLLSRPNLQPEDASITNRLENILGGGTDDIEDAEIIKDTPVRRARSKVQDEPDDDLEIEDDLDDDLDDDDELDIEDDDDEITDPETVAEYLGVEENQVITNDDGSISIATNVDGKIEHVTMTEIIKGYQIDKYNSQKGQKLHDEREVFDTERQKALADINTNIEASMYVLQEVEKQLVGEYNAINWDALRSEKPTEFNTLRADFSDKARRLDSMKTTAMTNAKKAMDDNSSQANEELVKEAGKQKELLLTHLPKLADTTVYAKTMTAAKKFMLDTYGVSEKEADKITDSRLIRLILDAQQFHKGKTEVKKKEGGKKLPKFMKPGARRSRASAAEKNTNQKRSRLRKTGSTKDAANVLLDRM